MSTNNIDKIANLSGMGELRPVRLNRQKQSRCLCRMRWHVLLLAFRLTLVNARCAESLKILSIGRNSIKKLDNMDGIGDRLEAWSASLLAPRVPRSFPTQSPLTGPSLVSAFAATLDVVQPDRQAHGDRKVAEPAGPLHGQLQGVRHEPQPDLTSAIGAVIGFSLFAACLTVLDGWRQVSNEKEFDKLMELSALEVRAASPQP